MLGSDGSAGTDRRDLGSKEGGMGDQVGGMAASSEPKLHTRAESEIPNRNV